MKEFPKKIILILTLIGGITNSHAQKSQTELDSIKKELTSYCQSVDQIVNPVIAQYELIHSAFDGSNFESTQAHIVKLISISGESLKKLDLLKPYKDETILKPAAQFLILEFQKLAQGKLQLILKMLRNPSAYSKKQYESEVSDVRNAVGNARRNYFEKPTRLFAGYWAKYCNESFCQSMQTYFNSMEEHFVAIEGNQDADLPLTWKCNPPFAGAKKSYLMKLGKTSCTVQFVSTNSFEEAKAAQIQLATFILSCNLPDFYYDPFTLADQASIDINNENTIDYIFRFKHGNEVIVRIRKSIGTYITEIVFKPYY